MWIWAKLKNITHKSNLTLQHGEIKTKIKLGPGKEGIYSLKKKVWLHEKSFIF